MVIVVIVCHRAWGLPHGNPTTMALGIPSFSHTETVPSPNLTMAHMRKSLK